MNISRPFINRPIATLLLMISLLLIGVLAYRLLPVSALPQIDYPTIQVYTRYPGSAPNVTSTSVTAPLERQFGQMAGLQKMQSTSADGASIITLQFELTTSLDEAEQEVQAAINAAMALLPSELPYPPVYSKVNPADTAVLTLALTSDELPMTRVQQLAETRLAQKISQMEGVGLVSISGGQRPAVRVAVNTGALQQAGLTLTDVESAIQHANINAPKGSLDGRFLSYAIGANDQLTDAAEFRQLVITWHQGRALYLGDIAEVSDSAEDIRQSALDNATPAILISIQRQPGANVIATVDRIRTSLPALTQTLPTSVKLHVINDRTETIRASVADVQWELLLAIILVVLVIRLFLRSWRTTVIPAITVPLSLLGTLAVAYTLGFSLNNLTLMALTVAAGFVVDDAIVMIENISRHTQQGMSLREATLRGAGQIGFTIISLSVSLIAVMIPLLFMGDVVGRLFREFALTLSAAIVVSAVLTLTLTPVLCMKLLPSHGEPPSFSIFQRLQSGYDKMLSRVISHQKLVLLSVIITTIVTIATLIFLPKGFFPQQDTRLLEGVMVAPPGTTFGNMQQLQQTLSELILHDHSVAKLSSSLGVMQTNPAINQGPLLIQLKSAQTTSDETTSVIARLQQKVARELPALRLYLRPVQDLTLDARSGGSAYSLGVSSTDNAELHYWTPLIINMMLTQTPFRDVYSMAQQQAPQLQLDIDRTRGASLGITVKDIDDALYAAFGQSQISTLYTDLSQYHVVLSASIHTADVKQMVNQLHIASSDGVPVPLASVVTIKQGQAPLMLFRQGQFPYADIGFNLAPGYSLGDAISAINQMKKQLALPAAVQLHFEGAAEDMAASTSSQLTLMCAAIIVVYLMLGMLYESFIHPLTILSTLPSAALGALLALGLSGKQFDVISLIGIVLLIGIVMKNAIMMIDFAIALEREQHLSPQQAIKQACQQRFRPILMTTLAALLGAVPLAFGSGIGSELRQPLGIAIIGGLLVSQLLTLFSTPVFYLWLHRAEAALARRI